MRSNLEVALTCSICKREMEIDEMPTKHGVNFLSASGVRVSVAIKPCRQCARNKEASLHKKLRAFLEDNVEESA